MIECKHYFFSDNFQLKANADILILPYSGLVLSWVKLVTYDRTSLGTCKRLVCGNDQRNLISVTDLACSNAEIREHLRVSFMSG